MSFPKMVKQGVTSPHIHCLHSLEPHNKTTDTRVQMLDTCIRQIGTSEAQRAVVTAVWIIPLQGAPLRHRTCNHRCAVVLCLDDGHPVIISQFGLTDIYSAANESRVLGLRALLAADR